MVLNYHATHCQAAARHKSQASSQEQVSMEDLANGWAEVHQLYLHDQQDPLVMGPINVSQTACERLHFCVCDKQTSVRFNSKLVAALKKRFGTKKAGSAENVALPLDSI